MSLSLTIVEESEDGWESYYKHGAGGGFRESKYTFKMKNEHMHEHFNMLKRYEDKTISREEQDVLMYKEDLEYDFETYEMFNREHWDHLGTFETKDEAMRAGEETVSVVVEDGRVIEFWNFWVPLTIGGQCEWMEENGDDPRPKQVAQKIKDLELSGYQRKLTNYNA